MSIVCFFIIVSLMPDKIIEEIKARLKTLEDSNERVKMLENEYLNENGALKYFSCVVFFFSLVY